MSGPLVSPDDQPTIVTADQLRLPPDPGTTALAHATAVGSAAPEAAGGPTELITCPECGATQRISLSRRDAADFCRQCDFPLFWTPSRVQRDLDAAANDLALRRLPGTVGRATIASLTCPHCAEPNALTAEVCIRCGRSLHPEPVPPPPAPVYVPPPPPPPLPEPEPEKGVAWWVWALIAVAFAATVTLIVLILTHTIG